MLLEIPRWVALATPLGKGMLPGVQGLLVQPYQDTRVFEHGIRVAGHGALSLQSGVR